MKNQLHFSVENGLCRSEKTLKTCVVNFVSIPLVYSLLKLFNTQLKDKDKWF